MYIDGRTEFVVAGSTIACTGVHMEKTSPAKVRFATVGPRPSKGSDRTRATRPALAEILSPILKGEKAILTEKELYLLELLSFGYANGDIAEHFQTSVQAVKNMLRTINLKLGADNRTHAVAIGFRNGWLPLKTTRSES